MSSIRTFIVGTLILVISIEISHLAGWLSSIISYVFANGRYFVGPVVVGGILMGLYLVCISFENSPFKSRQRRIYSESSDQEVENRSNQRNSRFDYQRDNRSGNRQQSKVITNLSIQSRSSRPSSATIRGRSYQEIHNQHPLERENRNYLREDQRYHQKPFDRSSGRLVQERNQAMEYRKYSQPIHSQKKSSPFLAQHTIIQIPMEPRQIQNERVTRKQRRGQFQTQQSLLQPQINSPRPSSANSKRKTFGFFSQTNSQHKPQRPYENFVNGHYLINQDQYEQMIFLGNRQINRLKNSSDYQNLTKVFSKSPSQGNTKRFPYQRDPKLHENRNRQFQEQLFEREEDVFQLQE